MKYLELIKKQTVWLLLLIIIVDYHCLRINTFSTLSYYR